MRPRHLDLVRSGRVGPLLFAFVLGFITLTCLGQGTLTFTFEGIPPGTKSQLGNYVQAGLSVSPLPGPGSIYFSGGGIAGFPDNGTGYLEFPDGNITIGFTSFPTTYFSLISFDAAEYSSLGPETLTVIGYRSMAAAVTNTFTLDGVNDGTRPLQDFQTFYLDSSFVNLFRVDVVHAHWSLDNLVISTVPEPSIGALLLVGTLFAGWSRARRTRLPKT